MAGVLDRELIQYFLRLNETQKRSLLELIKSFLKTNNDSSQPQELEEYNRDLDEAMERISNGAFTTLEQLEKEMQTW
ncbi:hypothetical protein BH20BAC1_BH20BAC1_04190 [soil metagenome]